MFTLTRNRTNGTATRPYATGLDRLFDEMTRDLHLLAPEPSAGAEFAPALEVTEGEGAWTVRAEVPGVAPEDVEVTVTGNVLTIRGEKKRESEAAGRSERRYGRFVRTLEFGTDLDAGKVEAKSRNGVLTVTLPKAESSKPKSVAVRVE
jgi:HSP20 family protein